jgi:hypothetical protein
VSVRDGAGIISNTRAESHDVVNDPRRGVSDTFQNTADPNANWTTRKELAFLHSLTSRNSGRVIQGNFDVVRGCNQKPCWAQARDNAGANGGEYPAAVGVDYCNGYWGDIATPPCVFGPQSDANITAKAYWTAGSLVVMGMHMPNPYDNYNNLPSSKNSVVGPFGLVNCGHQNLRRNEPGISADCAGITSSFIARQMLVSGTTANAHWNHLLDSFADGLADLQSSGVTVIMKTMHEQNDAYMWWESGVSDDYTRRLLFTYIENYFNHVKGLHNLLWAYVVDGGQPKHVLDGYPGSEFVDIVGFDTYAHWGSHDPPVLVYPKLAAMQKPIGIFEYDCDVYGRCNPTYDYTEFISVIRNSMPQVILVNYWWGRNPGVRGNPHWAAYIADPWNIMRSGLPSH